MESQEVIGSRMQVHKRRRTGGTKTWFIIHRAMDVNECFRVVNHTENNYLRGENLY